MKCFDQWARPVDVKYVVLRTFAQALRSPVRPRPTLRFCAGYLVFY